MEPINTNMNNGSNPGCWILPVKYQQDSPSSPPRLVEYWQWVPSSGITTPSRWVLVKAIGY